jgi:hypothetical protein
MVHRAMKVPVMLGENYVEGLLFSMAEVGQTVVLG